MQITLRSQMIAGATAVVGAGAIALTPIAPAVNVPSLSTAKAEVALSALANPISALLGTVGLVGNYTLNGVNSINPAINWPNSGIGVAVNNVVLPALGVLSPGILPNILLDPLPIITSLATNWLGYGYIAGSAAISAAASLGDVIWSVPATAVQIALEVLTFQFDQIIPTVISAVEGAVNSVVNAFETVFTAASTIVGSIIAKGAGVIQFAIEQLPTLVQATIGQASVLVGGVVNAFESIVAGLSDPNPIEGVWNAAVTQLLSPAGLPGVVVNITQGAGVQVNPADPSTFVPSVRTAITGAVTGVADIIQNTVPSATAAEAAPAASAVRADVAEAPAAVEAAPAAEAPAGDAAPSVADARSAAAEEAAPAAAAPEAAPAAAGDSAPADDAPAKSGKAGASKGGRG